MYTDIERSMRDLRVREERLRMLIDGQHMKELVQYVAILRMRGHEFEVPDFDPMDGGQCAKVLFLQEKPGPKTSIKRGGSGFISRNNDDATAANCYRWLKAIGIDRQISAFWNTIPWWNGKIKFTAAEREEGLKQIPSLLECFPELVSVVLVGKPAQRAEPIILRNRPKINLFRSPHPSGVNHRNHADIIVEWSKVKAYLDLLD